jgi:DNA polymerase alpha subunit A
MSERSRRDRSKTSKVAKLAGALGDLRAAREGTSKRATVYEVKQEEAVFDKVDEDQYAQLVAKRRLEAGWRAWGVFK